MISFIKDIFHKANSKIPYLTEKFSSVWSGIHEFLLPSKSSLLAEDKDNIFNQQDNPYYTLQDIDIHQILLYSDINILPISIQSLEKFNTIFRAVQSANLYREKLFSLYPATSWRFCLEYNKIQRNAPHSELVDILKSSFSPVLESINIKDNSLPKSQHFIVNLNHNHWTCLSLVKNQDILYVLYKDSLKISPKTKTQIELYIKNIASLEGIKEEKIKFITNQQAEQQDSISCGLFALKNIEIIQQKLLEEDSNNFLDHFAESDEFCKANDIPVLRTKYAKEYLHSQIKSIVLRENNTIKITPEILKQELKENLYISSNKKLEKEINTYVESYNPNAQLEEAFSTPLYSPIWLLNKTYPKTYAFQDNHDLLEITGAQDENYEDLYSSTLTKS